MSSRNRIIYQSEALLVGSGIATGANGGILRQLYRVQSANFGFNVQHQDVTQFGQLASIDRVILQAPTVPFDFSYICTDIGNEVFFGFAPSGNGTTGILANILNKTQDLKNLSLVVTPEGTDAVGYSLTGDLAFDYIGVGNGSVTSYSVEARIGGFPTASVNIEALNLTSNEYPAITPTNGLPIVGSFTFPVLVSGGAAQVSALRPGDITVSITPNDSNAKGVIVSIPDAKIQNFRLEVPVTREPLEQLGSRFPFSREIRFPLNASCRIEALVGNLVSGNLADILCNDTTYQIAISMLQPNCSGSGPLAVQFIMAGAKLDSQNLAGSIGPNETVTLAFSSPIGGPNDAVHNVFMGGLLV